MNRYGTVGWQEFLRQKKDILSTYDSAKESNLNRPIQTEHGNVGEASFRHWLGDYLPRKYGVTSGFIIPDTRQIKYTIRHYDVIIYDVLNSPVLWESNNSDKSERGRERAIPAQYVNAVFEVKSTLNKKSISDAVNKLQELNEYKNHLPLNFVSGVVFLELREENKSSCKLAEDLFRENIYGYFGGLILRSENLDPNLTGYYNFHGDLSDTIDMPLAKDIGCLEKDDIGNVQLSGEGAYIRAISLDDIWNFEVGYSPAIKNVNLVWSYNSFPQFFLDLIERLQGIYNPAHAKSTYGLSFEK